MRREPDYARLSLSEVMFFGSDLLPSIIRLPEFLSNVTGLMATIVPSFSLMFPYYSSRRTLSIESFRITANFFQRGGIQVHVDPRVLDSPARPSEFRV